MSERVPSDHETVSTVRAHLARVGRTDRLRIPLPDSLDLSVGDVVRVSLEGETYHTRIVESLAGEPDIRGAFDNARLARTDGDGTDHFREWVAATGLSADDPILVDTVTPGFKYGLRRPGERVVYDATDSPDSSLADIARDLDG
jgi:hypothetical protein